MLKYNNIYELYITLYNSKILTNTLRCITADTTIDISL